MDTSETLKRIEETGEAEHVTTHDDQHRELADDPALSFHFTGTGRSHLEVQEWAADLIQRGLANTPPGREGCSVFWGDYLGLYIDTPDGQRRHVAPGGYVTVNSEGWFCPADVTREVGRG